MPRTAVDYRTGSRANYDRFSKKYPELKLSFTDWLGIQYAYTEQFKFYLLETGEKATLPSGFGNYSIIKKIRRKMKGKDGEYVNLPIDWKKTKEKGKRMYNFNYHTEGFFFGWKWFKPLHSFKFNSLWYFKPSRLTSRLLAHYIFSDDKYKNMYREWKH